MAEYKDAPWSLRKKIGAVSAVAIFLGILGVDQVVEHRKQQQKEEYIALAKARYATARQVCIDAGNQEVMDEVDTLWTFWHNVADQTRTRIDSLHVFMDDKEYQAVKKAKKAEKQFDPPKKGYFFFNYEGSRLNINYTPPAKSKEKAWRLTDFDGNGIQPDDTTLEPSAGKNIEARLNNAFGKEEEFTRRELAILKDANALIKDRYGNQYQKPRHEFPRCESAGRY